VKSRPVQLEMAAAEIEIPKKIFLNAVPLVLYASGRLEKTT